MPKTFFSYARADAVATRKLATDLRAAGADLWIDQLDIPAGARWDASIAYSVTGDSVTFEEGVGAYKYVYQCRYHANKTLNCLQTVTSDTTTNTTITTLTLIARAKQ